MHGFLFGLLIGYGAALPLGPVNIELAKRNIRYSTLSGIVFGLGADLADLADLSYLAVAMLAAHSILLHPMLLKITSIIGSIVLIIFAISALLSANKGKHDPVMSVDKKSNRRHFMDSYLLTIVSPLAFLYWLLASSLIVSFSLQHGGMVSVMLGVFAATFSWVLVLNAIFHYLKKYLTLAVHKFLDAAGSLIILLLSAYSLYDLIT